MGQVELFRESLRSYLANITRDAHGVFDDLVERGQAAQPRLNEHLARFVGQADEGSVPGPTRDVMSAPRPIIAYLDRASRTQASRIAGRLRRLATHLDQRALAANAAQRRDKPRGCDRGSEYLEYLGR